MSTSDWIDDLMKHCRQERFAKDHVSTTYDPTQVPTPPTVEEVKLLPVGIKVRTKR